MISTRLRAFRVLDPRAGRGTSCMYHDAEAAVLRNPTLTALYNTWLDGLHAALDQANTATYGWPADLSNGEVLRRLLELNQALS